MKIHKTAVLLTATSLAFFVGRATSAPQEEGSPMEAAYMAPGEHHKKLEAFIGDWKAELKLWMQPGADPMVAEGRMKNTWVLDGRYIHHEYSGDMMGMPYRGSGFWGYNNEEGKHQGVWMDNMSTGMSVSEGKPSADGKVWVSYSEDLDPMSGEKMKVKEVTTVVDENKHVFTRSVVGDEGEFLMMEITYTR